MRKWVIGMAALAVLVLVNAGIWQREALLRSGDVVLLELVPVDPRSLMQGDFMALSYAIVGDAFGGRRTPPPVADGRIVAAVDGARVGRFVRLDDGTPLDVGEVLLRYRVRAGDVRFATNAWFFEEGHARDYASARYGEFRVAGDGEMLLTGLRDKELHLLTRQPKPG